MPQIWQLTLEEFIGDYPVTDLNDATEKAFGDHIDWVTMAWLPDTLKPLDQERGLFLSDIYDSPLDTALVWRSAEGRFHQVVGGYCDSVLWVAEEFRGRGLAIELVLEAARKRECRMNPISYTMGGLAAHIAAYREGVRRAWGEGAAIPMRILSAANTAITIGTMGETLARQLP